MPLNVTIPPKLAAVDAAVMAQTKSSPTDALVLHLYCDGSYKRGSYVRGLGPRAGIGIVANIWLPRDTAKQRTSKACFIRCDRDDDNTTIEAIALAEGAHVALDQIASIGDRSSILSTDRIEVVFWSDSTVVLQALASRTHFHAQSKKSRHILDIIKLKAYELQDLKADVSVHFQWCPRNCVEPHEMADHLSKQVRFSGGNTPSKAMNLFKNGSHGSIEEEIRRRELSAAASASSSSAPAATAVISSDQATALQQKGVNGNQSSVSHQDLYGFIEIAAHELPVQHKEVVLAAIDLQKKINAARTQDAAQDQVNKSKSQVYETEGQDADSDADSDTSEGRHKPKIQDGESDDRAVTDEVQTLEPGGQMSEYDGRVDENEGHSRETEAQIHESDGHVDGNHGHTDEPGSGEDGEADDEPEIIDQERPNRMRAMWTWVERRLPRT